MILSLTWSDSIARKIKLWTTDEAKFVPRPGEQKRYIIIHAGSRHGFVPNALKVFSTTQIDGDYHKSMNGDVFRDLFIHQLISKIPWKSIILMNNGPFHSVQVNKAPTTSCLIAEIKSWLTGNYISFDPVWWVYYFLPFYNRFNMFLQQPASLLSRIFYDHDYCKYTLGEIPPERALW